MDASMKRRALVLTAATGGAVAPVAAFADSTDPVSQVVTALTNNSGLVSQGLPIILGIAVTFAILAIGKKLLSAH